MKKYGNVVSGCLLILVSIMLLLETRSIKALGIMEFGPKIMPRLLSTALLIVGALIALSGLIQLWRTRGVYEAKDQTSESMNYVKVVATAVLIAFYVFGLRPFGFIVTTIVYLFCQFAVLGGVAKRRIPVYGLLSLGLAFGLYNLFYFVFNVLLPPGRIW